MFFTLLIVLLGSAQASDLDLDSQASSQSTKQILRDPVLFQEAKKDSREARDASRNLDQLTLDPKEQQSVRDLSADIFDDIVKKNGGDDTKVFELLQKAQADPAGFARSLTPEQQAKIRSLASEIEKRKSK